MNVVDVKKSNRNLVYQLVYRNGRISKAEIAAALGISIPTVSQCVSELKSIGLVDDNGFFESSGGRKAAIISCCSQFRVALGVEIRKDYVHIVVIDLYGEIIRSRDFEIAFCNNDYYCSQLCNLINNVIIEQHISPDSLEGVGIAIQGLTDAATQTVFFGKILDADGFSSAHLSKYLAFPCFLQHDTEAAAQYAVWREDLNRDLLYLVLNPYVGGAVVIRGEIHHGSHLASGLIEHLTLVPDGQPCYCGKKGCMDTYCSSRRLSDGDPGGVAGFFEKLRAGSPAHRQRWDEYLRYLALAISNYHMILNTEVVLGGLVAGYLLPEDLDALTAKVAANSSIDRQVPTISVTMHYDAAAGAALYFTKSFLKQFD